MAAILSLNKMLNDDRLMRVLTGLSVAQFIALQSVFSRALPGAVSAQRHPNAGRPHSLPAAGDKLFFILFYTRHHPTFDVAGLLYGVDRAQTCRWFRSYLPALEAALGREVALPDRKFRDVASLLAFVPEIMLVFPDRAGELVRELADLQRPESACPGRTRALRDQTQVLCQREFSILRQISDSRAQAPDSAAGLQTSEGSTR